MQVSLEASKKRTAARLLLPLAFLLRLFVANAALFLRVQDDSALIFLGGPSLSLTSARSLCSAPSAPSRFFLRSPSSLVSVSSACLHRRCAPTL